METGENTVARLESRIAELVLKLEEANQKLRACKAVEEELAAAFEARAEEYRDTRGGEWDQGYSCALEAAADMVSKRYVYLSWKVGK